MSSEPDPLATEWRTPRRSKAGHLTDLLIAFKWPILMVLTLVCTGLFVTFVPLPQLSAGQSRAIAIVAFAGAASVVVFGPYIFAVLFWVHWRSTIPFVVGDVDHDELHLDLWSPGSLDELELTSGLPRSRKTDAGPGFVVLEPEQEPESDASVVYDSPWFDQKDISWLAFAEDRSDWQSVRVEAGKLVRRTIAKRRNALLASIENTSREVNQVIAGFERDLSIEEDGESWSVPNEDEIEDEATPDASERDGEQLQSMTKADD